MHSCPGCAIPFDAPDLAGQLVACPRCGTQFMMPHSGQLITTPLVPSHYPETTFNAPSQSQPTVIVVGSSRYNKPLRPDGWFTRAFAATSGYLLATIILGGIAVFAGAYYLIGEAAWTAPASIRQDVRESRLLPARAESQSREKLKELGIIAIAAETHATRLDGKVYFSGRGKDVGGVLHSFIVVHEVATFGSTTEWHLETVLIDEEVEYQRPSQ